MSISNEGAFALLTAIVRQWMRDARADGRERYWLAQFLDCSPARLDVILARARYQRRG